MGRGARACEMACVVRPVSWLVRQAAPARAHRGPGRPCSFTTIRSQHVFRYNRYKSFRNQSSFVLRNFVTNRAQKAESEYPSSCNRPSYPAREITRAQLWSNRRKVVCLEIRIAIKIFRNSILQVVSKLEKATIIYGRNILREFGSRPRLNNQCVRYWIYLRAFLHREDL